VGGGGWGVRGRGVWGVRGPLFEERKRRGRGGPRGRRCLSRLLGSQSGLPGLAEQREERPLFPCLSCSASVSLPLLLCLCFPASLAQPLFPRLCFPASLVPHLHDLVTAVLRHAVLAEPLLAADSAGGAEMRALRGGRRGERSEGRRGQCVSAEADLGRRVGRARGKEEAAAGEAPHLVLLGRAVSLAWDEKLG
jgi:hypothetical protein